ncbi:MAG TPA: glycosyltransferase family 4 protein [Polyangia bacterium]|nr:glycosyltransferase family 4 protein [Polyangia bacterium]
MSEGRLRVLVVTELYPNQISPTFAIYNGIQFAALSRLCDVDVRATVPWFPGARRFKDRSAAGQFADLPAEEEVRGVRVRHPRFLFIPKIGQPLSPLLYAASIWPGVRSLRGQVDVVLGCWAFPDGLAAIMLARLLGAAAAVKVHGSDLNVLPRDPKLRALMRWGLPRADRLIAVSRPLGERAVELGVPRDRVEVVANGIDRDLFHPRDRGQARAKLGLPDGKLLLYIGRLDRAKGVNDLAEAFTRLAPAHPDLRLAIVGGGPEQAACQALAAAHPGRVFATGALPMGDLPDWIAACDILTLPSWNEGTPNVLLEALASGRRVVATRVGGIPDVVSDPKLGELVEARDVPALAEALARAAHAPYDPQEMTVAAPHSWPESAARLRDVLGAAVAHRRQREGHA